jgi:hypothetical protein
MGVREEEKAKFDTLRRSEFLKGASVQNVFRASIKYFVSQCPFSMNWQIEINNTSSYNTS